MTVEEWARAAIPATLEPLRRPPPVRLFPHQQLGARRLLDLLDRLGGALLFDGVGMGKSFTASAVAREWRDRGAIAVAAPAPLVGTWRATLARFGVDAEVVSHDGLAALAPCGGEALLVVDEAHRFRNRKTRRYRLLAERSSAAALLLVTATPLCNRLDDVRTLARLAFADDVLKDHGIVSLDAVFEAARPEEVRSLLALLGVRRQPGGDIAFPRGQRRVVRFSLGAAGRKIVEAIGGMEVPLCGEAVAPALVRSQLRARLESSPEALRDSLERQRRFYRRAREKLGEGFVLSRREFAALFEREERELFQELLFPEAFLSRADPDSSVLRAIERELKRIDVLLAALRDCAPDKFERLEAIAGEGDLLPAIVFTRAIATATRVAERFRGSARVGVASSRGALDYRGVGVPLDDLVRAFRTRALDLLVLTDLASEGLDLQAAATVVHFDLPWTAVKLDQRNGRAIRMGQVRDAVRSIYFLPETRGERTPLRFVARKERLANQFLEAEAFARFDVRESGRRARLARAAGGIVVAEHGALFVVDGGRMCADPRRLRAIARNETEPFEDAAAWWAAWKETALLLPSRVERGSPAARIDGMLGPEARDALHSRLAARYRAGVERQLDELAGEGAELAERLAEILDGASRVTGRSEGRETSRLRLPWTTPDTVPLPAGE